MKMFTKFWSAAILAVPATVALAEPLPPRVADMDCIVGSWKGGGSVLSGHDQAKVGATWDCKRVSAKFGVLCTFHVTGIPGVQSYDETDLMGYEPNTQTYHWYSVTNASETHDHVAQPASGNTLEFVFNGTQDGKPLKEVIALTFADDKKSLSGRAETFVAGASTSVLELKLKK